MFYAKLKMKMSVKKYESYIKIQEFLEGLYNENFGKINYCLPIKCDEIIADPLVQPKQHSSFSHITQNTKKKLPHDSHFENLIKLN